MVSPQAKSIISRIIPFGLIWLIFSLVYSLLEKGILGTSDHYPSTGNPYHFASTIIIVPVSALFTGLIIGAVEVLYLNKLFIKKTFTQKIVFKTAIYFAVIIFFLFALTVVSNAIRLQTTILSWEVWRNAWAFFSDFAFWSVGIYIGSIIGVSLFYSEVSQNLGQGVLNNFFTGKYHQPVEEERIFMFLDMKASTTIAENIGHVKYFEMLREYFADLTKPITNYSGEIYQYVGDEIVVSWKLSDGLRNNNCIQCYFAMEKEIKLNRKKYIEKFGLLPEFKAGLHVGKVTTGEIGVIKKEIIFTGDVLNTTSRIQGLCNSYRVNLLLSDQLVKKLKPEPLLEFKELGKSDLRGREERIDLFTVQNVS